jgi:Mrp family chromosome partitioning ATPase
MDHRGAPEERNAGCWTLPTFHQRGPLQATKFVQAQSPLLLGIVRSYPGKQVKNPAVLLNSERLQQFFCEIKAQNQYRYVILDSSPILLTSDPSALTQQVDAAILVVRAGKTPRKVVLQAIETLGADNILGCVFNGVTSTDSYDYHYYYSTEYYPSTKIESNS